ncbi:hypothetical protein CASFOL_040702 [Castilleja foliolosa]|uniref:Uncharacterized protein n=1 Tax=Castilleja foliolosa TaxID=1961234 RepID=A0ABD3BD66_9LAMI
MMDSTDVLQRWWIDGITDVLQRWWIDVDFQASHTIVILVGLSELMSRAAQRGAERRLDSGGDGDLVG